MSSRILPIGVTCVVALVGSAWAQTVLYVDGGSPVNGPGNDWEHAYHHLQDALGAAEVGDTVRVAEGTHRPDESTGSPTGSDDRAATFQLISGVTLEGGYAGHGAADPDERNITLYATILSGNIGTQGNNTDNSYHVVTGSGTDGSAVIDGFTITGGNANGAHPHDFGGGMYNLEGSPTLRDCMFTGNSAWYGGGMANEVLCNPTLTSCTFSGNTADNIGGGMYNEVVCRPKLTNCVFSGNTAYLGGAGGMYNYYCGPKLTNCTFSGNAANSGGAMMNYGSTPIFINCILFGDVPNELQSANSTVAVVYTCIQGGYAGVGNIDDDPQFVDPDGIDNTLGTPDDDLRIQVGSPCIDAGMSVAVGIDRDGNRRIVDDPVTTDSGVGFPEIIDMGAYEHGSTPPPLASGDMDGDGDLDGDDIQLFIQALLNG